MKNRFVSLETKTDSEDKHRAIALTLESEKTLAELQYAKLQETERKEGSLEIDPQTIAVCIHAYYPDVLTEIADYLMRSGLGRCDWYITCDTQTKADEVQRLCKRWREKAHHSSGKRVVEVVSNIGRNVRPLAVVANRWLDKYEYALHLHTKKTADEDGIGRQWRIDIIGKLIGDKEQARTAIGLMKYCGSGVVIPTRFDMIDSLYHWGGNLAKTQTLLSRVTRKIEESSISGAINIGATVEDLQDRILAFPAGLMFWFKPAALSCLWPLLLDEADYSPEPLPYRNTMAHAAERSICYVAELSGFSWSLIHSHNQASVATADGRARVRFWQSTEVDGLDHCGAFSLLKQPSYTSTESRDIESTRTVDRRHIAGGENWLARDAIVTFASRVGILLALTRNQGDKSDGTKWTVRKMVTSTGQAEMNTLSARADKEAHQERLVLMKGINKLRRTRARTSKVLAMASRFPGLLRLRADLWFWAILGEMNHGNYRRAERLTNRKIEASSTTHTKSHFLQVVRQKYAYKAAYQELLRGAWTSHRRVAVDSKFREILESRETRDIFFWHHYDTRGYLPETWKECLIHLQKKGKQVVVSTNALADKQIELLRDRGIAVLFRANIGLCLCAYKDFMALLIDKNWMGMRQGNMVIFCNDSTLPVTSGSMLANAFDRWTNEIRNSAHPTLWGMTDSVQLEEYHLQSYCFAANSALLLDTAWHQFWASFKPVGTKLEMIRRCELGLSQEMLKARVKIKSQFSIIDLLAISEATGRELAELDVKDPRCINPTVFAWKSLIGQGFPLIKKQVLFEPCDGRLPELISLAEVDRYLDDDIRKIFWRDVKELMMSRYLKR